MELYGKGDEIWEVDEGLRDVAISLIHEFPDELGHVEVDKVIFVRVDGVKLRKDGKNWLGKCWYLRAPVCIMSRFVLMRLGHAGVLDLDNLGMASGLLDLSYIIGLNTMGLLDIGGDGAVMDRITLHHELLHIRPDMEGLVPHPIQDFGTILDRYGIHWTQGVVNAAQGAPSVPQFLQNFASRLNISGGDIGDTEEST